MNKTELTKVVAEKAELTQKRCCSSNTSVIRYSNKCASKWRESTDSWFWYI